MPKVDVARAAKSHKAAIANMFQLYIHDFSEQWFDQPRGELNEDGLFDPYPYLDAYWEEEDCTPLLIRADGKLAGFALLNPDAHSERPADQHMAEFFVARKHRRAGVGLAAAQQIFNAYTGLWEVAVAARNVGALSFWRRAAAGYKVEEVDGDGARWAGRILFFQTG